VLYTGDGASGRSVVGVGFTPDLVWIKSRTVGRDHRLQDSVRGFTNVLSSDLTSAEYGTGDVSSTNNDGFSLLARDNQNVSGENYVAWCWRAGAGTTSTNTNGSITSVVSVNQDAGFSIVSFTMTSGTYTVGHGLGKTPKFIITKQRDGSYGWWTQHASIGAGTAYLDLSSTAASTSLSWGGIPNSSTFTINNSYAVAGQRVIAYCWAEIEGFSKAFSYTGNGSTDGPMVWLGFRPALVIIKCSSDAESWYMYDSSRKSYNDGSQHSLFPNLTDIESTGWPIDFLSNGFKNRYVGATNNSGRTYIGIAFAESPFTTANAK
jgi:hypothetical protein